MDNYAEGKSGFWKARSYLDDIFLMRQVIEKTK